MATRQLRTRDASPRSRGVGGSPLRAGSALVGLALAASLLGPIAPTALAAPGALVTFDVLDRDTQLPVPDGFRYLVNEDVAHSAPSDPPSLTNPRSYAPIVAWGDDTDATVDLEPGKYLVSVLGGPFPAVPGDAGYKLWGAHFTVPDPAPAEQTVTVELVPNPLPLSTIRARIFMDNLSVNGEDDIPLEDGLEGFQAEVEDRFGDVISDYFNNPVCTEYDSNGDPVPGTGGVCLSDAEGHIEIPNLGPGKYEVKILPPQGEDDEWYQTSTIEGTHGNDAWVPEGATGFSTEEGFLQDQVWFGFVRSCSFGSVEDDAVPGGRDFNIGAEVCPTNNVPGAGTITGRARQIVDVEAPGQVLLGGAVPDLLVALNNIGGNDEQVYVGRGNPDGTFTIPDVPAGLYQVVLWDEPLDYIIQFHTVRVTQGQAVDLGDIGLPRWFGRVRGFSYLDTGVAADGTDLGAGARHNGLRDCHPVGGEIDPMNVASCEPGIAGQDLDVRHKDGSVVYATFADDDGFYEFPEYFEWEHFLIWEVGYGRFEQVGTAAYDAQQSVGPNELEEADTPVDGYPTNPIETSEGLEGLLQAQLTPAGWTTWIDSGKLPHQGGATGGIAGIVFYGVTRNEFEARFAANEDYEPGVPGVGVNLYTAVLDTEGAPVLDPDGSYQKGQLVAIYNDGNGTDLWDHPGAANGQSCDPPPLLGQDPPPDPLCLELPRTLNQVKDGVFDGGYAFDVDCRNPDPDGDDDIDGIPNRFDADSLVAECDPLGAGQYVVEIEPPPGYHVVREEDQNTDRGDDFVTPAVPPPPCAGALHLVVDDRNPFDGQEMPLCDAKYVELAPRQNAAADFFVMTENEMPPPGLLRGLLLDDLHVQMDPNSVLYGDKRGLPDTPVGIFDYLGNHITTVYTDENGYWEVLLPSTYNTVCPIPTGVCQGMYDVVGNYPGDPTNPDPKWNPNYGSLRLSFDLWPGLTTYADVAILPITGFTQDPQDRFQTPPECDIDAATPDLQEVSAVSGPVGTSFTISGAGFGTTQGTGRVTLDGTPLTVTSWSDTSIGVTIPPTGVTPGRRQLLVTADNGEVSPTGLTFHLTGTGYNPTFRHVGGGPTPYPTIQAAIDAGTTAAGNVIVVHPGVYYETVILHKQVALQGYGPGATVVDGRFFNFGGMTPEEFETKVAGIPHAGPATVPMGQTITVLPNTNEFNNTNRAQVDGLKISGGTRLHNRQGSAVQGGGIYAHADAERLQVSNDLIQSNAGNFGGGVILGQPYVGDLQNDLVRIHHNRILNNGGVSLAGGIGLFNGAQTYEIDHNVICGNYSAEYGGGISHYGLMPGNFANASSIHDNAISFNYAFDEGGGVMIAGEQPTGAADLSAGSGNVNITANTIRANVSNDDGGGIRLLQPVDGRVQIVNNAVVNNLASDVGGGVSLDDALDVRIVNNTIAKNITTATAEDADRASCGPPPLGSCPHGAGLVSEVHSAALMDAEDPPTDFSDPVMFNNVFWENEAFRLDGTGALPSAGMIDLEVYGTAGCLTPNFSILTQPYAGCAGSGVGNKIATDPLFLDEVDLEFDAVPFGGDPAFVTILVKSTPAGLGGDYHIGAGSPAIDAAVTAFATILAPTTDIDGQPRSAGSAPDVGADEVQTPPAEMLFSLGGDLGIGGAEDVLRWTRGTTTSVVELDLSMEGLAAANVDAVHRLDANSYLLSFAGATTVPDGVGLVGGEDVVRYDATSTGANNTAGTFSWYFDGGDVGLSGGGSENVDAVSILPSGAVILSTTGTADVPTIPGTTDALDSDLLQFTFVGPPGEVTTGSFALWFDGSDVGLATGGEDIDDASVLATEGHLYLTTQGGFNVGFGNNQFNDVFYCLTYTPEPPPPPPGLTTCTYATGLFFDGATLGLGSNNSNNLDGLEVYLP